MSSSQMLLEKLGANELTPVEFVQGLYFKRDDLFAPFGSGSVNGGKLRQGAFLLAQAKEQGNEGVITGCSLISPQAPMIAAAAKHFGMSCTIIYGGTKLETLLKRHMPRLAMYFKPSIEIAKSGRANVLLSYAKKLAKKNQFIVAYGMNSQDPVYLEAFYNTTARQVENLPNLDNLFITCGSGITAAGIIYGLAKFKRTVKKIWLLGTGPNRIKKVQNRLSDLAMHTGVNCWSTRFEYVDLFAQGMVYEKRVENLRFGGIEFHPHYEAKSFQWLLKNLKNISGKYNGFWIVGAEPQLLK